ncbi:MAG: hypothetical protein F4Z01_04415 [Gammaproteobacteria bacterium]|nr:hypothetical protein [Gammaproteobacteria bacterium]MYF37435.1 hypothetical protein [Gammaproteobacteria bacterium]
MPPPNKTNTRQGINIEELLQNSLPQHPRAFKKVKEAVGIPNRAQPIKDAENIGLKKRKTDAVFKFGDEYPLLRVSVKSFSKDAGYNHVERKSLSAFCRDYRISVPDQKFLETLFLRKAAAEKGRRTHLVNYDEQGRVREIFDDLEVGATSLLGRDHPQIFAIYSIERSRWHLYDIPKQVLPVIRQHTVTFTQIGRNIEFGDYIVLQRKGSAKGEHSGGHPITDIRHRANDVQVKMRTRNFFNEIKPLCFFEL